MASRRRRDLSYSKLSHHYGGPVCLTKGFISYDDGSYDDDTAGLVDRLIIDPADHIAFDILVEWRSIRLNGWAAAAATSGSFAPPHSKI